MPGWLDAHLSRPHTDNILHLLVRDAKWSRLQVFNRILSSLLRYMNESDLSVDVEDCEGQRALEISIRTDNLKAMKLLLDHKAEFGVKFLNDGGILLSPLGLAMGTPDHLGLIAELMRRTRKAQGLQAESALALYFFAETLHRLDLTMASSTREPELHDAYVALEQIALSVKGSDHGFDSEDDLLKIVQILSMNWDSRQLSISERDGKSEATVSLKEAMQTNLQRCVIHIITKDLCNHTSLFARDMPLNNRIRSALQLRCEFELPNLEIEPSVLFEALQTPVSQQ